MDERRATYGAAVRLAVIFSTVAALAAITLQSFGDISTLRFVAAVAVVGFLTSWVRTGRVARSAHLSAMSTTHRSTMMSTHHPIG